MSCLKEIIQFIKSTIGDVSQELTESIQDTLVKYNGVKVEENKEDLVQDICDILYDEILFNIVINSISKSYDKDINEYKKKINKLEKQKNDDIKKMQLKRRIRLRQGDEYPHFFGQKNMTYSFSNTFNNEEINDNNENEIDEYENHDGLDTANELIQSKKDLGEHLLCQQIIQQEKEFEESKNEGNDSNDSNDSNDEFEEFEEGDEEEKNEIENKNEIDNKNNKKEENFDEFESFDQDDFEEIEDEDEDEENENDKENENREKQYQALTLDDLDEIENSLSTELKKKDEEQLKKMFLQNLPDSEKKFNEIMDNQDFNPI